MIDIDKLTEAQVRYILKAVYDGGDWAMGRIVNYIIQEDNYPQQTNNEEVTMIKKIKIVNHDDHCVRDTTIGKVYMVTHDEVEGSLYFFDDEGDDVMIRVDNNVYEVVEED